MTDKSKNASSKLFGAFIEKMKADKKFELAVYAVLIMLGVMIFAFSSCDGLLLTNTRGLKTSKTEEDDSADEVESRLADMLSSIDGAGKVKVMIMRADDGSIRGAIVTAEGASNISVREKLQNAVKTVLGIELNQVEIFQMETNNTGG